MGQQPCWPILSASLERPHAEWDGGSENLLTTILFQDIELDGPRNLPRFFESSVRGGPRSTIASYPFARAALFILASRLQRHSSTFPEFASGSEISLPKRAFWIFTSSPINGFLTLTLKGSSMGRPQNSASRKIDAWNLPLFWYALGSTGGTCHRSFRLTWGIIFSRNSLIFFIASICKKKSVVNFFAL